MTRTSASEVPDLVAVGLRVLFCGINPGRRSGETGRHFAGPGNRFWKCLHQSGLTPRLLSASEQGALLELGLGITNLVARSTSAAAELTTAELRAGAGRLGRIVADLRPGAVAVLGVGAYRSAFRQPRAGIGPQPEALAGAALWVLPNPSGLQAHYSLPEMTALYRRLAQSLPPPGAPVGETG